MKIFAEQVRADLDKELGNTPLWVLAIMLEFLRLFNAKQAEYGPDAANELGIKGQYADMHRKFRKLKRAMWEGEELKFEKLPEVILDLIGHEFLTLKFLATKGES